MDNLEKVLDFATRAEDKYYDLAYKEMERNNALGNQMCIAQASAFQRVRYYIEELLKLV